MMGREDRTTMKRRHTPEQVIRKLAEGEKLLGLGKDHSGRCVAIWRSPSRPGIGGGTSTAG